MKNIQKKISLLAILCFSFSVAFAQTIKAVDSKGTIVDIVSSPWLTKEGGTAIYNKNTGNVVIGNGTEPATVNANAALQFTQTDKGIMIPKVALVDMFSPAPFTALGPNDDGLLVYNTATGGTAPNNVIPGFYYWDATTWKAVINPSEVTTVGGISGTATTNGASITGNTLNLAPADASNGGVVTTTAQTIAGAKTFSSDITVNGLTVGRGNSSNQFNTVLGLDALRNNIIGGGNTAVGRASLTDNVNAERNTAIGAFSLRSNNGDIANENSAFGYGSLFSNLSGFKNTALGTFALSTSTSGNNNTAIGYEVMTTNTTGSNNTAVGFNADVGAADLINATAIGAGAIVAASNTIQLGNTEVTDVNTSGKLTTGTVTYPNAHNATAGQVLTINSTGTASWTTITASPVGTSLADASIWVGDGNDLAQPVYVTGDIEMNNLGVTTIAASAVTTNKIAASAVTNAKLANSTVKINGTTITLGQQDATITASPGGTTLGSAKMWVGDSENKARGVDITGDVTINNTGLNTIGPSKVTTVKIADGAVTEAKIADGAVTVAKIGGGAVTEAKIATNAVTTDKILNANVTNDKLANPTFTINETLITLGQQDAIISTSPVGTALGESYIWVGDEDNLAQAHVMSGDVTINNTGVTTIGASKVTYDKIQNVSATNSVLGRVSAGAGAIEEIPTTGSGNVVRANAPTFTGLVTTVASNGSSAGFRIPHGAAPSSPVNGDLWTTTGGLFLRQNGNTHRLAGLTVGTLDFTGTTLTFGSSTAASTIGIGTGATVSGSTKTVNIGTGASEGTTNVTIGSATGSTTKIIGSVQHTYTSTSSELTLNASHRYVVVRAGVAITLPAAATVTGTIYTIIAKAPGVTITSFKNFSDANTTTIGNGTSITIISNGTDWEQVN